MDVISVNIILLIIGILSIFIIGICELIDYLFKTIHNKRYKKYIISYEPNYKKISSQRATGDCAIRAICKLFDISWNQAFDRISKFAKANGCITSTSWMLFDFFRKNGYSYIQVNNAWYKRKQTFGEFVRKHPKGKYAIFSETHVAAVENGKLYDSWDSSKEPVYHIMKYIPGKSSERHTWCTVKYTETSDN